ncbi:hypothetical protein EFA69_14045 [Rufibacter immobilis]|uniref:Uncharacterized protein n=1 Tax=Rufibacter immobilis TaxID=1348778 RepID=A0A3M9MPX4_9BACT|nr:hypothetical protein [Rufibacter immobilis]RNI27267.1 hypothetical protein EFA69_14045 [Rufibacter immobilis]
MKKHLLLILAFVLPIRMYAQAPLVMAPSKQLNTSLQISLAPETKEAAPLSYSKRADTFLLFGLGLNIISAGTYLMVPGLVKKVHNPSAEYLFALDQNRNNPVVYQQITKEYESAMAAYVIQKADRDKKIKNARLACLGAFSLGVAFDLASIYNFKKAKQ